MRTLYRSAADREVVARWCRSRLDAWEVPHRSRSIEVADAKVHLTFAGTGPLRVLFVPGTNFNAGPRSLPHHCPTRYSSGISAHP
ncbi:hypothetical protein AB0K52_15320 [Glycomyces sp. NPDC049804]|uniref:hypothetical protein n=1 Tax=Glycomyces sp. NPDC049804 TaxID=3154363 RepID=UPI003427A075